MMAPRCPSAAGIRSHTSALTLLCFVLVAGMAAGVVQTFIVAPVELLKVRQQLQTAVAGDAGCVGPVRLLRQILRAEGVRGKNRFCYHRTDA